MLQCYTHLVKCIHQAAKEALGEKILRCKTKPFEMDQFKRLTGLDRA